MASVNTNAAALTALRTLQQTNTSLDATQKRISTGYKIGEAKDNSAYWAISTTLKSDNKALATVKDALNLGASTVDTAYQGLNKTKDVLDEIKTKLTAASQDGVDRTKIQAEISQLQDQLRSIASSSSFSGQNWLSVAATPSSTAPIVASFNRGASGSISIGTINVTTADMVLVNTGTASAGILTKNITGSTAAFTVSGSQAFDLSSALDPASTDDITYSVTQGTGSPVTVHLNEATITNAGLASGKVTSTLDLIAVMKQSLKDAGISGIDVSLTGSNLTFTSTSSFTVGNATNIGTSPTSGLIAKFGLDTTNTLTGSAGGSSSTTTVLTMNITSATSAQIRAYADVIDQASKTVIAQAANLGAIGSRLDLQKSFVDTLMDTIDKGVGNLIDADMSEESTKLQALQVKQQLGTQALSIANQAAQNILTLFRS